MSAGEAGQFATSAIVAGVALAWAQRVLWRWYKRRQARRDVWRRVDRIEARMSAGELDALAQTIHAGAITPAHIATGTVPGSTPHTPET